MIYIMTALIYLAVSILCIVLINILMRIVRISRYKEPAAFREVSTVETDDRARLRKIDPLESRVLRRKRGDEFVDSLEAKL